MNVPWRRASDESDAAIPLSAMSVGRKLLFSAVAVALVLAIVELALWAVGVERLVEREDAAVEATAILGTLQLRQLPY